jgi:hypothetical protein
VILTVEENATTVEQSATVPTGWMDDNPRAYISIFVEPNMPVSIGTHIVENGTQRVAEPDEVSAGNYHCSVLKFGSAGGVEIFTHREELVRLLVVLSDHLNTLDNADDVDRKVAEAAVPQ